MKLNILIVLILIALLLTSCATQIAGISQDNSLAQETENEEKIVLPEPKQENILQKNPEKCPDGVWDEAEQINSDLCPDDNPNLKPTDRIANGIGDMKEGYVFTPDPGMRKNDASNPGIYQDKNGIFYLYYRDKVATSADGLNFSDGMQVSGTNDFRGIKLPDGAWRIYYWDERGRTPSTNFGLKSKSSKDGAHYIDDPGYRYQLHESDLGTAGIHEFFVDNLGGVVLLYIGDLLGLNNIRRAYSKDNGWTFNFEKGNILGDANDGKPGTFIDHKIVTFGDGKKRLYAVRQGSIYSFISSDDGKTFAQEPGVRLSPSDFTEFDIAGFSDPVFIKLLDGRWRVYATAFLRGYAPESEGSQKEIIVSATMGEW